MSCGRAALLQLRSEIVLKYGTENRDGVYAVLLWYSRNVPSRVAIGIFSEGPECRLRADEMLVSATCAAACFAAPVMVRPFPLCPLCAIMPVWCTRQYFVLGTS